MPGKRRPALQAGFTLIELLIVIAIISLLASMTLAGVVHAKRTARLGLASGFVAALDVEVERIAEETGRYPGWECPREENAFPVLFEIVAARSGQKPWGREDVAVVVDGGYRRASVEEIEDLRVRKLVLDPWGNPYIYRENRSRPARPEMRRPGKTDLYSTGPDGVDQVIQGVTGDDIGPW